MLIVENIKLIYPDGDDETVVLENVSLQLDRGLTALVGPSGVGKSSLLRIIAGLQLAQEGSISFNGQDYEVSLRNTVKPQIATYVPQDFQLVPFLNARENIELAAEIAELSGTNAREFMNLVGMEGLENRIPEQLSGGQQQRLALARALAIKSPVLLADEPTGSLDESTSWEIGQLLHRLGQDRIVLAATHDPVLIRAADSILTLQNGQVMVTR